MKVFGSWQNDVNPAANRRFIRDALAAAIKQVGDDLGLEAAERPELDHDTKGTPGMAEIAATIQEKIRKSAAFVADGTPVGETAKGRALPNPNVMIELGWAQESLGSERVILILNTAGGWQPDALPFDVRHRRILTYALTETASKPDKRAAKEKLIRDLAAALKTNLATHVQKQAEAPAINGVAARPGNPSVWETASDVLEYEGNRDRAVDFPDCPRAYMRLIPAAWPHGIPMRSQIEGLKDTESVNPVAEGTRWGDCGPCEQGYVWLWATGLGWHNDFESRNVVMWFKETGEFWSLHGTAVLKGKNSKILSIPSLLEGWQQNLRQGMAVFDKFGASPARRVEAGLVGLKGASLPVMPGMKHPIAHDSRWCMSGKAQHGTRMPSLRF